MNNTILVNAIRAGCPRREAEVLATYVESASVKEVALLMGLSPTTVTGHLGRAKRRLGVAHTAAAVAKLAA